MNRPIATLKHILLLLATASLLFSCKPKSSVPDRFRLNLAQDSGYISSGDALRFLLDAALIDTTGGESWKDHIEYAYSFDEFPDAGDSERYYKSWYTDNPADTIGKYYAFSNKGNYIVAFSLGSEILLLELTPLSDVVYCDLLGHGNHPCCWNSIDDMLKRYGPYFGISTCGTGSSYCSGYLYLYKDCIESPQSTNSIPTYEFVGGIGEMPGHLLTSDMEFTDSSLVMYYHLEEFTEDGDGNQNTVSLKNFSVKYVYRDGRIETDEADKLEGILL